jgi:hypothetical protein
MSRYYITKNTRAQHRSILEGEMIPRSKVLTTDSEGDPRIAVSSLVPLVIRIVYFVIRIVYFVERTSRYAHKSKIRKTFTPARAQVTVKRSRIDAFTSVLALRLGLLSRESALLYEISAG